MIPFHYYTYIFKIAQLPNILTCMTNFSLKQK